MASHADNTYDTKRAPKSEIKHTVEKTRRHLLAITRSTSLMLARSHVCSLQQQIEYNNDIPPNNAADWDRKSWSRQNFFTTPDVSVDPGNFILGTMFLAIRHALGIGAAHQHGPSEQAQCQRIQPIGAMGWQHMHTTPDRIELRNGS